MEIKLEIKNRITGKVLFEFETENNNTQKTLLEAIKQGAYLRGADLRGADLRGAYLQGAYLRGAYLQGADLRDADLRGAYLQGADLQGADLRGAYLQGAYLRGADLRGAYLQGAYLRGADLRDADLQGADLQGVKIKRAVVFTSLYKYIAIPFISEKNELYIRLGCYTRLLSEWESNFWNNDSEFPNDGSMDSKLRVFAFETCKKWLELNK